MKNFLSLFAIVVFVVACSSEPKSNLKPLDLLEYGIPITIMAPDSAKVRTMDLVVQKDVTVKGDDDYYVQIYASGAETTDVAQVKAEQLAEVKGNRYFSKIVQEDESGFIYETQVDSNNVNYGFRLVRIQGDQEYIFQTGLIGSFTLEKVEEMYQAVQPE